MKLRNTRRYAVKTSVAPYANIISSHCTLQEAYKAFVKAHKAHYVNEKYVLARDPICIIASEASARVIQEDINKWANFDGFGPVSKKRLPLPIVVHQWNTQFDIYLRYGAVPGILNRRS